MRMHGMSRLVFFFFQAEDGIRDTSVTGVQTCALPISETGYDFLSALPDAIERLVESGDRPPVAAWVGAAAAVEGASVSFRSEERRVGKECRCGWWPCP